jgi:FKBP-type peptidyl-prolyl cis-trans isomerase FklB
MLIVLGDVMNKDQKHIAPLASMMILLSIFSLHADEGKSKVEVPSKNSLLNYSWAAETARESSEGGVFVDLKAYMVGVSDAASGKKSLLSEEEAEEIFVEQMNSVKAYRRLQAEKSDEEIKQDDSNIMALAKKNKNSKKTMAGLLYQVLKSGSGAKPRFQDSVKIQYAVRNTTNKITYESKTRFTDNAVAIYLLDSGIAEALQYMQPGSVWRLYLTSDKVLRPGSVRTQIPSLYEAPKGGTIIDLTLVDISGRQ